MFTALNAAAYIQVQFIPEGAPLYPGSQIMTDSIKGTKDSLFTRLSLYRGIYSRVARQLGIDPSYVSRVARGERRSGKVETALLKEMKKIEKAAG